MVTIKIGKKEFQLKYTIESWKKLKEHSDITPQNFQDKIGTDPANVISSLVYYGINPVMRKETSVEEIDMSVGFDVMDTINDAIAESLPSAKKDETSEGEDGAGKK